MKAFVIFRDRVTYARYCLKALMDAQLEVVIVDHGSTWPAALSLLRSWEARGITVLRRGGGHPRGLWGWEPFNVARGSERYIVTDPDVVPALDCPPDWPQHLGSLLDKYPDRTKAGLGLRIDNLPDHYSRKQQVVGHETQFWQYPLGDGAYRADIDTTLALYREGSGFDLDGALRTGPPYIGEHLAWYEDLENPTDEQRWYYDHAERGLSHWAPRGKSAWND